MDQTRAAALKSDELTPLGRLGVMFNVATLTALLGLIPAALVAGSGHFGESFREDVFAALLGGTVAFMVLLCLWTPFAKRGRVLTGMWSFC